MMQSGDWMVWKNGRAMVQVQAGEGSMESQAKSIAKKYFGQGALKVSHSTELRGGAYAGLPEVGKVSCLVPVYTVMV